jgi:hypothetical protein
MIGLDKNIAAVFVARVAAQAPHAVRLAAQLFGIAPCEHCDMIKSHCKCHEEGKGSN